ncbi:MAG: putative porin [Dysgonamonadaceae bacterium]|jgi:hypothetical protein|nr:putative porin [Dysgonamonadaceae bacterium]
MRHLKSKTVVKVRKEKKIFSNFSLFVLYFSLFTFHFSLFGQDEPASLLDVLDEPVLVPDTIIPIQKQEAIADTVLRDIKTMYLPITNDLLSDSTKSRYYWRITERTGEIVAGNPDTLLTDFSNRQLVEGQGISMQYLGNLGLPAQSRVYFERPQRSNFMFQDNFSIYTKTPGTFDFINTKIPYSNISYIQAGNRQVREERLGGALSVNFGKKLNVGLDFDYLYARGYYQEQSAKNLSWILYGSYISDRYRFHAFVDLSNQTNRENGGITDERFITNPDETGIRFSRDIPTVMRNTWNHISGVRAYLNYRYNLGFERETNKLDSLGNPIKQFVPVSTIIATLDYDDKFKRFNSSDSINLDKLYASRKENWLYQNNPLIDSTSYWRLRPTAGISMREGFSKWAKFDLTAFITFDINNYTLMSAVRDKSEKRREITTYIGGEIAKRKGKILRYDAQGSFGVVGDNVGDFNVSGNMETRIPILGDTASLIGSAYIKYQKPTFYERTFRSKYFVWDNDFKNTRRDYIGGTLNIPHTKTRLNVGVENITDYIYFNEESVPEQYTDKKGIQVFAATLEQNLRLGILNWNNQLAYQISSDTIRLPLPDLCLYSNLFIQFKIAKVLTMQIGGGVHFFTKYCAPTYEPVTQQFRIQNETRIGEYPLVNAYINCHLKNTRFFIQFYNVSSSFVPYPAYFSTPLYPVNPQIFKWGLSWDFNN